MKKIVIKPHEWNLPEWKILELISQGKNPLIIENQIKQIKIEAKRFLLNQI